MTTAELTANYALSILKRIVEGKRKEGSGMTLGYLSVSGLKNYLTCPQKYLKAQIEKLRPISQKAFFPLT